METSLTAISDVPEPTPTAMPVPPVALPPLGTYPATGTDPAKDQWLRLADLYVREAQRATSWASSTNHTAAMNDQAAAMRAVAAAQAGSFDGLGGTIDRVVAQWAAHDAALDRLTAALSSIQFPAGGGSDGGLTAKDVEIVGAVAKALKP